MAALPAAAAPQNEATMLTSHRPDLSEAHHHHRHSAVAGQKRGSRLLESEEESEEGSSVKEEESEEEEEEESAEESETEYSTVKTAESIRDERDRREYLTAMRRKKKEEELKQSVRDTLIGKRGNREAADQRRDARKKKRRAIAGPHIRWIRRAQSVGATGSARRGAEGNTGQELDQQKDQLEHSPPQQPQQREDEEGERQEWRRQQPFEKDHSMGTGVILLLPKLAASNGASLDYMVAQCAGTPPPSRPRTCSATGCTRPRAYAVASNGRSVCSSRACYAIVANE